MVITSYYGRSNISWNKRMRHNSMPLPTLNKKKLQKLIVKGMGKLVAVPVHLPKSDAIFKRNLNWSEDTSLCLLFVSVLVCMCLCTFYNQYVSEFKGKRQIWWLKIFKQHYFQYETTELQKYPISAGKEKIQRILAGFLI